MERLNYVTRIMKRMHTKLSASYLALAFPLELSQKEDPQWPSLAMGGPTRRHNIGRCVLPCRHIKKEKRCALILTLTPVLCISQMNRPGSSAAVALFSVTPGESIAAGLTE